MSYLTEKQKRANRIIHQMESLRLYKHRIDLMTNEYTLSIAAELVEKAFNRLSRDLRELAIEALK